MCRHTDVFQRTSGSVTCRFSHINSTSVFLWGCVCLGGSRSSAPTACLTLQEPIYNLEHLLCIPREDCLVWAAPDFNLASQIQFPNLSSRLSVRGPRSRSPLVSKPLSGHCPFSGSTVGVFAVVNRTLNTPHLSVFPMGGWVCICVCKQVCVVYSVARAAHWKTVTAGVCATCVHVWKYVCACVLISALAFVYIVAFAWIVSQSVQSVHEVVFFVSPWWRWCVIEVWMRRRLWWKDERVHKGIHCLFIQTCPSIFSRGRHPQWS